MANTTRRGAKGSPSRCTDGCTPSVAGRANHPESSRPRARRNPPGRPTCTKPSLIALCVCGRTDSRRRCSPIVSWSSGSISKVASTSVSSTWSSILGGGLSRTGAGDLQPDHDPSRRGFHSDPVPRRPRGQPGGCRSTGWAAIHVTPPEQGGRSRCAALRSRGMTHGRPDVARLTRSPLYSCPSTPARRLSAPRDSWSPTWVTIHDHQ